MTEHTPEPQRKCPHCGSNDYPNCCEMAEADAEDWLADEQHSFSD